MCKELSDPTTKAQITDKVKSLPDGSRDKMQMSLFLNFCAGPSVAKMEKFVADEATIESKTCKIASLAPTQVSFKKVGPTKWVANVGPSGMCNATLLYTMESDDSFLLFKWTQTRTYIDTSNEFCKGFEVNKKLEYSWNGNDPGIKCEYVTFGL
jgi:hypothetical protein